MAKFLHSRRDVRHDDDERDSHGQPRASYEEEDGQDQPDDPDREHGRSRRRKGRLADLPGTKAVAYARQYLQELVGQTPESVSGLSRAEAGWKVKLDVVELERVPRSTDVMASYEVELDESGELLGYRRVGRFYRNQVDER